MLKGLCQSLPGVWEAPSPRTVGQGAGSGMDTPTPPAMARQECSGLGLYPLVKSLQGIIMLCTFLGGCAEDEE